MKWRKFWRLARDSVALRLTLYASLLTVVTPALLLAIFYAQTSAMLDAQFSRQVRATAQRLIAHFDQGGRDALIQEITLELSDQVNAETEVLVLLDGHGQTLAGNADGATLPEWPASDRIQRIALQGQWVDVYLVSHHLPDGSLLIAGQDAHDLHEVTRQLKRLLLAAGLFILIATLLGAFLFRRALQQRVEVIRKTATQVSDGLLNKRVPVPHTQDEFALLTHDINHMLERIERLMTGVRHVSDSVAHNLRTPIARILLTLRLALRQQSTEAELRGAAAFATAQLEELSALLEKLLQLAEMESGMRRSAFSAVDLGAIVRDVADLYSAFAEAQGATLALAIEDGVCVEGDRELLASAVANLVDNALKYAGNNAVVNIRLKGSTKRAVLTVADNGPGIAPDKRDRIGERFYRADSTNNGYGLGLASVIAIASLHDGEFRIAPCQQDTTTGTTVALDFPRVY